MLIPSPPFNAPLEIHDVRQIYPKVICLKDLTLLPFYNIEQTLAAILLHVRICGQKKLVRWSRASSLPLDVCLIYGAGHFVTNGFSERSIAWVGTIDGKTEIQQFEHPLLFAGDIWVELNDANLALILRALAGGKGKLVVRFWRRVSVNKLMKDEEMLGRMRRTHPGIAVALPGRGWDAGYIFYEDVTCT